MQQLALLCSQRMLVMMMVVLLATPATAAEELCEAGSTSGGALVQTSSAHLQRSVRTADDGQGAETALARSAEEQSVRTAADGRDGEIAPAGFEEQWSPAAEEERGLAVTPGHAARDAKVAPRSSEQGNGRDLEEAQRPVAALRDGGSSGDLAQAPGPDPTGGLLPGSRRAGVSLRALRGNPVVFFQLLKEHVGRSKASSLAVVIALLVLLVVVVALAALHIMAAKAPREPYVEQRPLMTAGARPAPRSDVGRSLSMESSAVSWSGPNHFCPELVVPLGHEALLAVPLDQTRKFQVKDLEGKAVIAAEVTPKATGQDPIVVLTAFPQPGGPPQGSTLAYCRLLRSGADVRLSTIEAYNSRNVRFATITRVTNAALLQSLPSGQSLSHAYMLAPMSDAGGGIYLLIGGDFRRRNVTIVNERKDVMADTEPTSVQFDQRNAFFKLRVTAGADVGLLLCALLSIQVLETAL